MGMLDRYKKKGGFSQLLTLIETSGKQKQEQFLGLIKQENPVWEDTLKKKLLTIDAIFNWPPEIRSEIFSRLQPLTLGSALHGYPKEKLDAILSCFGTSEKRKIEQVISEVNPTPAEKSTCHMKIINETRGFIAGGIIKLEKFDPVLAIPENIEEHLNNPSAHVAMIMAASPDASHEQKPADPSELRFELPPKHTASDGKEDTQFLKAKVNQLVSENAALKHEVNVLRGKLDQIKKIA